VVLVKQIKAKLKHEDEFGVINYHAGFLFISAFCLLYGLIALLALPLVWFETSYGGESANILTYADAFWTLQMSASTIGFGDFYPVTLGGRTLVALVFYFGVGLVGFIGAILASSFFGFAETSVKNRELRKQNETILAHSYELERKLDRLLEKQ
jgi:voltage-gated potassium channel